MGKRNKIDQQKYCYQYYQIRTSFKAKYPDRAFNLIEWKIENGYPIDFEIETLGKDIARKSNGKCKDNWYNRRGLNYSTSLTQTTGEYIINFD
mgnify:CR=1 FL=1